jgi:hypothetical protein
MTGKSPIFTAHSDASDLGAVPQFESTVIAAAQPATILRLENGISGEDGGSSWTAMEQPKRLHFLAETGVAILASPRTWIIEIATH